MHEHGHQKTPLPSHSALRELARSLARQAARDAVQAAKERPADDAHPPEQ